MILVSRKLLAALLGLGALAGFASGFHALRHHGGPFRHGARRAAFEEHIAEVCTRAAEKVARSPSRADARPAP